MRVGVTENWRERSLSNTLSILFLLVLLLVGLQVGELDSGIRDSMYHIMKPGMNGVQEFRQIQRRGQFAWLLMNNGSHRLAESEALLAACQLQDDQSQLLMQENELLRQALGRKQTTQQKAVRLFGSDVHWFIDAGSDEGISAGQVVSWQGSLVGRVTEANQRYSRIQTLLDREWQIPVQVGTQSAKGLFQQTHGYPQVVLLPRDAALQINDIVQTAGNEDLEPGIPIGRVKRVEKESQGVTWQAEVEPYFNYQQNTWVYVTSESK